MAGQYLNTAIPKDTAPLDRLLGSTAHFGYNKKKLQKSQFCPWPCTCVHQEGDVAPTDWWCQANWSCLKIQNLRLMTKIFLHKIPNMGFRVREKKKFSSDPFAVFHIVDTQNTENISLSTLKYPNPQGSTNFNPHA